MNKLVTIFLGVVLVGLSHPVMSCERLGFNPTKSSDGTVTRIRADIYPRHLKCGTSITSNVRKQILKAGFPSDQSGHIIAKELGGIGSAMSNVVPMKESVNKGPYKQAENRVVNCLRKKGGVAKLDIKIKYGDKNHPHRPTLFIYKAVLEKCSNVAATIRNS